MDNLDNQIQEFWENRTSPEQRREILRQLDESRLEWKDFLLQYYNKVLAGQEPGGLSEEQARRVWQRLRDQHLGQSDGGVRNSASNAVDSATGVGVKAGSGVGVGDTANSARVMNIGNRVEAGSRGAVRRITGLPWMAAACVLLIVGLCIYHWGPAPSVKLPVREGVAVANLIVEKNRGAGEESLSLPDHSVVLLAPGSCIRYQQPFEARARTIRLEGRALFEVTKDSLRPFTVMAQGFATTALGTRFIVDATRPVVSIRLLKGKIVVNATAETGFVLQKMYLTPGQELKINTTTKQFARVTDDNKPSRGPAGAGSAVASLSFERTNLAVVFRRLSEYYKTPILYDKTQVQGLSFTGDFKYSDKLDLALKVVCSMNRLSFTKESDHIVISKQQ